MSFDAQKLKAQFNPEGSTLRNMQLRMLELLKVVDILCKKYNLKYWVAGGTMLGAVRHKGFIPWDDDLDIEMLKTDYDKLIDVMKRELPDYLAIQCMQTDPNYFFQYAKLRDRRSRLNERNSYDRAWIEQGIFIDIFPIERIPMWAHKLSNITIGHVYSILNNHSISDDKAYAKVRKLLWINTKIIYPCLRRISRLYPPSYYDDALGIPYFIWRYPEKCFPLIEMPFEDMMVPVLKDYKEHLIKRYGDYMQLPNNPGAQYHADNVVISNSNISRKL